VFSKAGIFSPAYWIALAIVASTRTQPLSTDARVYFYAGGKESGTMVPDMQGIVDLVRANGIAPSNLRVEVNPEAAHNETAWRAEFPRAVEWLFEGVQ